MNKNILDHEPEMRYSTMMRDACPVPGEDWYKFMTVRLLPKARIGPHAHVYHTVLYYPEIAEPVYITPQPGTMLYLPPGTIHQVPAVQRERLSVAMLIEKAKT